MTDLVNYMILDRFSQLLWDSYEKKNKLPGHEANGLSRARFAIAVGPQVFKLSAGG